VKGTLSPQNQNLLSPDRILHTTQRLVYESLQKCEPPGDIGDLTELFYQEWTLPSAIESSEYAKAWMDWNVHRDQKSSGESGPKLVS
jgi:hypothetical protein